MAWCLTILTLVCRDWGALPYQSWFYRRRMGLAFTGALVVAISLYIWTSSTEGPGLLLCKHLSIGLSILAFLASLSDGGQQLTYERTHQTLDLLLLSDVRPMQLMLAKLIIAMGHSLLTLLVALPLFAIAAGLGGVSWRLAAIVPVLLIAVVFLGAALGLGISAATADTNRARIYTSVVGLILYLLLPATLNILFHLFAFIPEHVLIVASPVSAIRSLFADQSSQLLLMHLALMTAAGIVCIIWGCWRLPRSLITNPRPPILQQLRQDLRSTQTMRRFMTKPIIQGNPVAWQDLHLIHGGKRTSWLKLIFGSVLLSIVILIFGALADMPIQDAWSKVWIALTIFQSIILIAGMISSCLSCFQREKQNGALEVLLTSDLRCEELLVGKMIGVILAYSPYGICLFVSFAAALTFKLSPTEQMHLFLLVIEMAGVLYVCCAISLYLAIRSSHRSSLASVFIAYSGIWAIISYLFPKQNGLEAHALFTLISTIWHIYVGTLCWRVMLQQGREMLLESVNVFKPPSLLI